jgi:transcriptional regulator with XRE-family HTH domain
MSLVLKTKMLGALLRGIRKQAGKSLQQTSEILGISRSTLASYELGRKGISLPELEQLAFHFDVPLGGLLARRPTEAQPKAVFDPTVVVSFRQKMIGALLRRHRKDAELSLRELGERVGLPSSRVSAYERGLRPIPVPELEALAQAMGHSIEEYVDTQGRGPVADWHRSQIAYENFRTLPGDVREFLSRQDSPRLLRLAIRLEELSIDRLRHLGELISDIAR